MPSQNNNSNSNSSNANSVTPIQGIAGATTAQPQNMMSTNQQQGMMGANQSSDTVTQLVTELVKALQENQTQNEQFPSSSSTRDTNSDSRLIRDYREDSDSDYDYFEVEQKIIKQIQEIKRNADSYGDVVEIVGRRAVLAKSNNGGRGNGYEFEYLLSDGRIMSNDQCWELANAGKIKNVISSHNHGRKYIRSVGDGMSENNLGNLPTF